MPTPPPAVRPAEEYNAAEMRELLRVGAELEARDVVAISNRFHSPVVVQDTAGSYPDREVPQTELVPLSEATE